MKRILLSLVILTLLTACGPTPTPSPTVDVVATAKSVSATMAAATLTAQPTATPLPTNTPVPTATFTPEPTFTPLPSDTPGISIDIPTQTPSAPVQGTSSSPGSVFQGTLVVGSGNDQQTGLFRIENETEETITVTIYGKTKKENTYYISYLIERVFLFNIPWGSYNYTVQIGNKKTFAGSFGIGNKDKTTMIVSMQKVKILGP
jgi:hypothetical protein